MEDDVVCNTVSIYICAVYGIFTLFRHAAGQHKMCVHSFECVTVASIVTTSVKLYI